MSVTVYSVIFPNVIFAPNDTFKHFCLIQNLPNMVLFLFKNITTENLPTVVGNKRGENKMGANNNSISVSPICLELNDFFS